MGVMVVLIGPYWLVDPDGRRRLDEPDDVTRFEIEAALARDATVLPVLVGGAQMPAPEELPEPLRPSASRAAFELTDRRWAYDG